MTTAAWAAIGTILSVLVAVAAVAAQLRGVAMQLRQGAAITAADHTRRRAQATIEFYLATMDRRNELRDRLADDRDGDAVALLVARIKRRGIHSRHGHAVRAYLNLWEALGVGVAADVYDKAVVEALTGGRVIAIWDNYEPFIAWRRDVVARSDPEETLYVALERLADDLRAMRDERSVAAVDLLCRRTTVP